MRLLAHPTGFYIHTCPKMKYKAEYQPSYLLDPVNFYVQTNQRSRG